MAQHDDQDPRASSQPSAPSPPVTPSSASAPSASRWHRGAGAQNAGSSSRHAGTSSSGVSHHTRAGRPSSGAPSRPRSSRIVTPEDLPSATGAQVRPVGHDARAHMRRTSSETFRVWFTQAARNSPSRLAVGIFAGIIAIETALLALPISSANGQPPNFVDILFTAVSTVCVTGLTTVDTATQWSTFGHAVIAIGVLIGGLGVMTLASILGMAVSRHLGLTQRMLAAQETKQDDMSRLSGLLVAVLVTSLTAQGLLFCFFFPRFLSLGGYTWGQAAWEATFMSISVFNNAGFTIMRGGLAPFVNDWWMLFPIIIGSAVGAVGFPVIQDLAKRWRRPQTWALHTKLTLAVYLTLTFIGAVMLGLTEWSNPHTLGALDIPSRTLNVLLAGVNTRSSGLSALDVGAMRTQTHFVQDILMMIGGGSASTAGGIKVTTFAVLLLAVWAEARGDRDIEVFHRRIPPTVVRLAVAVTLMGIALVSVSVTLLLTLTDLSLDIVLFETISAFATVGLSTGVTPALPDPAKYVLIALMFAGRTGTMTVAAALALREGTRVIRMPEERPIIG
ncbi:MAG: potassium transporter TrkG [Actinomycetaceae bacterium]|nr:potassium transporter TrkG [Actinomycetaceae bacterium]